MKKLSEYVLERLMSWGSGGGADLSGNVWDLACGNQGSSGVACDTGTASPGTAPAHRTIP